MKKSVVSVDIGGTFTDIILYDGNENQLWKSKIPSSAQDYSKSFMEGIECVLNITKTNIQQLQSIALGTTLVTNSLLEKKTARAGLIVTEGFRDILEIGRQTRPHLYDFKKSRPSPLVHSVDIIEVPERIGPDGKVLRSLDVRETRRRLMRLLENDIETVAVSLLFSFLDDRHEAAIKKILKEFLPEELIFLSSQISPEFREFERTSTTVIAASVAPKLIFYLKNIHSKLNSSVSTSIPLNIMHSGGGILSSKEVISHPHTMIESGPAAGVIACGHLMRSLGINNAITFDMGGTTAKAGLILNGKPGYTTEYEVGSEVHQHQQTHRTGYPVRFPMIDLVECGAGAGSIAWIDDGGHLQVGPQSAGADPGPACYGKGGTLPAVTDAYLVLGYLHPDSFLGGRMAVYPELAEKAIKKHLCPQLGIGMEEAASAVYRITNANIIHLLHLVSISRGHDPRDFALIAFGGAGPLHAAVIAEAFSINKVIIPQYSGVFSSLGLLCADLSKDFVKTGMFTLTEKNLDKLNSMVSHLEKKACSWFQETETPLSRQARHYSLDMRYCHQNYELNIPLSATEISAKKAMSLQKLFHQTHRKVYGHSTPHETIQIVNVRLRVLKRCPKPYFPPLKRKKTSQNKIKSSYHRIFYQPQNDSSQSIKSIKCRVLKKENLYPGVVLQGPAIVQEEESTTLINTNWTSNMDEFGNLILTAS
jgi:N-methylhydantoinase A